MPVSSVHTVMWNQARRALGLFKAAQEKQKAAKRKAKNAKARYEKLKVLRANRLENWKRGQLDDAERVRFRELQIKWMGDPNCAVDAHDAKLRQKFEQYVMVKTDEGTLEARNFLREVESGDKYCRPGKSGRMFQFHDPDFPSNSYSVGLNTACRGRIKEWRESIRNLEMSKN